MPQSAEPILFYEVVGGPGGAFFSPWTIRARLAFALKRLPITTIEVTFLELVNEWTPKLGVKKATAPFIQKPDGSYLMGSDKIIDWLEASFPDRTSVYLPEAEEGVKLRKRREYWSAADLQTSEFAEFAEGVDGFYGDAFNLFAPLIIKTFDEETKTYWTSDARMGPGKFQSTLDSDPSDSLASCKAGVEKLSALLSATGGKFFASRTKPGFKDLYALGPWRLLASSSRENARRTYVEGGLGEWLEAMEGFFGEEWRVVAERDPE